MAATSASSSWSTFARRAFATSAVAAVALISLAVPASAHTPKAWADCKGADAFAHVKLENYVVNVKNTVTVTEGETVLLATTEFPDKFTWDSAKLDGSVVHKLLVSVKAGDDPKWSVDIPLETKKCVQPTQPPTKPTKPTSTRPSSTPPSSSAPAPVTTTTPPVVGANASLASTGASIALPLGIGALLLIGGGVMLLIMRRRGKA